MRRVVNGMRMGMRNVAPALALLLLVFALTACSGSPPAATDGGRTVVAGVMTTPSAAPAPTVAPSLAPDATETAEPARAATVTSSTAVTNTAAISTTATAVVDATFELSRYAGRPGETLSLRADGFAPGETVRLQFMGAVSADAGEFQAGDRGEGSMPALRIPPLPESAHSLVATGATSGRQASRIVSIVGFHPWVVLSLYAPRPGDAFGFRGSEFVPGEQVQVILDGAATPLAAAYADDRGDVRQETLFQATSQTVGKHELQFVSAQSGARLPVTFEVLAYVPIMELTSYAGPPGSVVGFTGRGFAPGETIHAYLEGSNGREEVGTFQADRDGAFANAGQFAIPATAAAEPLTIALQGADSLVPVSQRFGVLNLAPWAGLSAYSGPAGTQIDFHGKGFAVGETVDVLLGKGETATKVASAVTDARGDFQTGPFTIPADARGNQSFTFRGQNSKGEATTEFTVPDMGG